MGDVENIVAKIYAEKRTIMFYRCSVCLELCPTFSSAVVYFSGELKSWFVNCKKCKTGSAPSERFFMYKGVYPAFSAAQGHYTYKIARFVALNLRKFECSIEEVWELINLYSRKDNEIPRI